MVVKHDKLKTGQVLQAGSGTYKHVGRPVNIKKTSDPLLVAYSKGAPRKTLKRSK